MENHLLIKLKQLIQLYKFNEKILITPDFNIGNQILQDLSVKSGGWINFKASTVLSLACEIAEEKLLSGSIEMISSIESNFLIDEIFSRLAVTEKLKYFKKFKINSGIINAINNILIELKMSGIAPVDLKEK